MSEVNEGSDAPGDPWPRHVFEAPELRGIDGRGRAALEAAGSLLRVSQGARLYEVDEPGDAFYVVVSGRVTLTAVRRGDAAESTVRTPRRGESFGLEVILPGSARRLQATADEDSVLAVVPVAVYERAASRSGAKLAAREQRALERAATRDLLSTLSFTRELSRSDQDIVLDAARHQRVLRGERIYGPGDPADAFYLITDGLVQLAAFDDPDSPEGGVTVQAYLGRGDFFGDLELSQGGARELGAVALGPCALIRLPAEVIRVLADRNPGLLQRLRRISTEKQSDQSEVVERVQAGTTAHVFRDLYRMQMARALLVIDQDTCVRCGHCAWACESTHGVARLVRRGDKLITRLAVTQNSSPDEALPARDSGQAHSLLLPNSCQHCKNPVCMIDCPTGAIGRDPKGEVFIREELCTGCGNCAKACPWENIRMAPRITPLAATYPEVAVKCDLCRDYEAPACVQACPTESIFRLDPGRDISEVQAVLGLETGEGPQLAGSSSRSGLGWVVPLGATLGFAAMFLAVRGHQLGALTPVRGWGLYGGWVAGVLCFALAAYAIPKRMISLWMRPRTKLSPARKAAGETEAGAERGGRSRVRLHYLVHVALGLVLVGATALHAGARFSQSSGGLLLLTLTLSALFGIVTALAQWLVPARLTRLEREGVLPEDLKRERQLLEDRLYREASGRSELVKKLLEVVLLPYARAPFGFLLILLSGRTLGEEQARLRARTGEVLKGRGGERLAGLDALIRVVIDMRALLARRLLLIWLRALHLPHLLLTGAVLVLLVLHVVGMWR